LLTFENAQFFCVYPVYTVHHGIMSLDQKQKFARNVWAPSVLGTVAPVATVFV